MEHLPTVNHLGYASFGQDRFNNGFMYLDSEFGDSTLFMTGSDKKQLGLAIVAGQMVSIPLTHGNNLQVEFHSRQVTLSWEKADSHQQTTFDEAELIRYLDIELLRPMTLNRRQNPLQLL